MMEKAMHMAQDINASDISTTTPSISNILAIPAP
jgi:hypothetical protein